MCRYACQPSHQSQHSLPWFSEDLKPRSSPSCSRIVAYLLFASGHELRLQRPVTLYSFLQKFCVCILHTTIQTHTPFSLRITMNRKFHWGPKRNFIQETSWTTSAFISISFWAYSTTKMQDRSRDREFTHFDLKLQCTWLMTCHITSSDCILTFPAQGPCFSPVLIRSLWRRRRSGRSRVRSSEP